MNPWETLSEIVRTLFIMSATGSMVVLLLLIFKPIFKNHLPKRTQYYLWVLVLAAFLVPFSVFVLLPFATPMAPLQEMLDENVKTTAERREELSIEQYGMEYEVLGAQEQIDISFRKIGLMNGKFNDYVLFALITMGGVSFLMDIIQYIVYIVKLRRKRIYAERNEVVLLHSLCKNRTCPRLYRNSLAATPMLLGVFRPVIYLPDREYSGQQLQNILLHELTHLRRHDVVIKWIAAIAVYVHWFNPIAYLARRELDRACELACDEAVISSLDTEGKQSYGDTLIDMVSGTKSRRILVSTTMCEEKKALKERLGAIMKSKNPAKAVILLSYALLVAVFGIVVLLGAYSNYVNCSTLEGRELRLREISNLGDSTTISQEIMIDGCIISGYTTNNRYGLAIFAPDGNETYKFQTNDNRQNDDLLFTVVSINHKLYNVFWANKADLDYAEIIYTTDENIEETITLDAKDNKIIYTDAPSNSFSVEFYFFDMNGNRYE